MAKVRKANRNLNYYTILLLIATLFMSIGYASINNITLDISGNVSVKAQDGVFITDVEVVSSNSATYGNNITSGTMLGDSIILLQDEINVDNLEDTEPYITYKISIYNSNDYDVIFNEVIFDNELDPDFYTNPDIAFTLNGLDYGDVVASKTEPISFYITFKYKDINNLPNNDNLNFYINFEFLNATKLVGVRVTENTEYIDGDNIAIIPTGFTVSMIPEEQNIDAGLVIYDIPENEVKNVDWNSKDENGIYNVQTLYNQFVWVPLDANSEFKLYKGYEAEALQNWIGQEPYNDLTQKSKYTEMKESILKYNGFYVGRYEAGTTSTVTSSLGTNGEVFIKQGINPYAYIRWSSSNTMTTLTGGAVQLAEEFSENNNYTGITSSLLYGAQWDTIMAWIDPAYKTSSVNSNSFIINSNNNGYYIGLAASTPTITGSSNQYAMKNIYDLAGNVWEWTMEYYSSNRVSRGGCFWNGGWYYPVSSRWANQQTHIEDCLGFRIALFID